MEKLFLTQIHSLDNDGGCTAGNAYFSELFDLTKSRCSQIIKGLEDKKMIEVTIKRDGKLITQRVCKILNLGIKYFKGGIKYTKLGYLENAKENNTEYNNTKEDSLEQNLSNDKRLNKQLPFDVVSASETLNATYQEPFSELKEDIKNIFQIEVSTEQIKQAIFTFSTVAIASYDKYKCIRDYNKLINLFKDWIPKSIKYEGSKPPQKDTQLDSLEDYISKTQRPKDLEHLKKIGLFQQYNSTYQEQLFKLTNIAKGYTNENISPLLLFELMYMPLGYSLGGSTPERKLDSFERFFKKLNDYNKKHGDIRALIKERANEY